MTNPYDGGSSGPGDYFDPHEAQDHLLIIRFFDRPEYVRTGKNKDGMVYPQNGGEPFPNRTIRAAVADLSILGPDGQPGRIYSEAWLSASSLQKACRGWLGHMKLVTWRKEKPNDKTASYTTVLEMHGDPDALAVANAFRARHPEFEQIPAPPPYEGKAPEPKQPQSYGQAQYFPGHQPPQTWGQAQYAPPQQQPQYQQAPPPQWQQQPPAPQQPAWQPPAPQWQQPAPPPVPPSPWNTAAPPPGYQQPQAPGNFYEAAAQMPQGQVPQGPPVNHHGQPQPQQPPY